PTTGTDGGGNISIDPLFCNPDSGDYNLAENSSCVSAGANGSNVGAFGIGCGSIHIGPLWYVATTGSDETGNGTDINPFATIQTAIDSSSDGDTVLVGSGTYVENIDYSGKNLVVGSHLINFPDSTDLISNTIIDGDSVASCVTLSGELIGFTLRNGLSNNPEQGSAIHTSGGKIKHCLIKSNYGEVAIAAWGSLHCENITTAYQYDSYDIVSFDAGSIHVINSIITNGFSYYDIEPQWDVSYTNFSGYDYPSNETNIQENSFFCNPSGGDFSLGENSPCVGTGENGANMGAFGVGCGIINQVLNVPADYGTVQAGIDATIDGDTVLVAAGTYVENINFNGKNIVVTSSQGTDNTIIDGNQDGSVVTFENGENSTAILSGFTITNGNGSGSEEYLGRGGGIFCINSSPTLKDLTVAGNQTETSGAGLWFGYSNSQLVDLVISNNSVVGEGSPAGGGISINYNSDLTINNILVVGNEAVYGAGIELWSYSKPLLNSVTIVGNTGSNGGGLLLSGGCHPTINNSIIWGNSPHEIMFGIVDQPDSVSIYYSDVSGGQDSILTNDNGEIIWGLGNIDANPLFCGSDSGDFTLSENSPCIGAGYFGANMGAFDVGCGPYNFSPTEFSLSEPSNNTQLTIDESNMNDGYITFSWGESSDVNGDSLYYLMRA
ncbi:uncharacterized protein METZ01_LOCUS174632, partial [marine metagenome]